MTEGPYKLPEGWRWVRLGEVCDVIMGQSPPSSSYNREGLGLPFFQGKADFGEIHPISRVWCTEPKKVAEAGDILISVRAPVGPTNLADSKCCIGRGLAALRVGSLADRFWVLFYLRSIEDKLATSGYGSTFNAITKKELCSLLIPLPPLSEQRRIVARIEALMARVREARRLRQAAREEAERLWQSVLADTFPRPGSALPPGWRWVRLGEVFVLKNGSFIRKSELKSIGSLRVYGSNGFIGFLEGKGPMLREDSIVIGRVGACGAVNWALAPAWVSDNAMYVAQWILPCEPRYIFIALKHADLGAKAKKGAQPSISQHEVYSTLIPFPPLEEQRRIVAHLEAVQEKLRALRAVQAETEEELKRLEQAILDKAFQGGL
jgi:type I restriction enzyme S subunit